MHRLLFALLIASSGPAFSAPSIVEKPTPAASSSGALLEDIGIETLGGVLTPLLARGCKLPCASTKVFSNADDGQTEIKLFLYRGTAKLAKDGHRLGAYVISGIPAVARGRAQVAITFAVDADQITLSAFDKKTDLALEIRHSEN
ncbi:Hsp70 family protein [Pseudoduganella violaceinigra]|uniref:Hsp70 family protein n=1 Tax=Pseudoduganella violaceinigra TaxID=246602 RepID=UPI0009FE8FA9|nr:Hsp70 family protein [Pseudoduganella violaceinigra]